MRNCRVDQSHLLSLHGKLVNENLLGDVYKLNHDLSIIIHLVLLYIFQLHHFNLEEKEHRLFFLCQLVVVYRLLDLALEGRNHLLYFVQGIASRYVFVKSEDQMAQSLLVDLNDFMK